MFYVYLVETTSFCQHATDDQVCITVKPSYFASESPSGGSPEDHGTARSQVRCTWEKNPPDRGATGCIIRSKTCCFSIVFPQLSFFLWQAKFRWVRREKKKKTSQNQRSVT